MKQLVTELYVTIIPKNMDQLRLIELLKEYGFYKHGVKTTSKYGDEDVYVRDFTPKISKESPKLSYPYFSKKSGKFIVSIYPKYHTELLPDSKLQTESADDFEENKPYRNAISKVFVSRSPVRDLEQGDIIIFYRTGGLDKSVITTLGVVENIQTQIKDFDQFKSLCRKRSVFSENELKEQWTYKKSRPFIVNFLYSYTFPKSVTLKRLIELRVIPNVWSAPMGFKRIREQDFEQIIRETDSNDRFIVN
jgi:MoaA/NifB/PqqE/SkfB family radical SAM enzyme